jgi:hypothetical protein
LAFGRHLIPVWQPLKDPQFSNVWASQVEQFARSQLDLLIEAGAGGREAATPADLKEAPPPSATVVREPTDGAPATNGTASRQGAGDAVASGQTEAKREADAGRKPERSRAEAGRLCSLYCAICTKKHSLLKHLFEVYAAAGETARCVSGCALSIRRDRQVCVAALLPVGVLALAAGSVFCRAGRGSLPRSPALFFRDQ